MDYFKSDLKPTTYNPQKPTAPGAIPHHYVKDASAATSGIPSEAVGKAGGVAGAAIGQIGTISDVWGNISMSSGSRMNEEGAVTHKVNTGANTLKMASAGATIGSALGPWGTVIGGAAGALVGLGGSLIGEGNEPSLKERLQRKGEFELSQYTKRIMPEAAIARQQLMAEEGMDVQGNTKQIEVEKDELVLRKIGKIFKVVADFKGGDTHANGGEQYVAQQGDVIFPGKDRGKIKRMIDNRRWGAIESARMKLPIDTPKEQYYGGTKEVLTDNPLAIDPPIIGKPATILPFRSEQAEQDMENYKLLRASAIRGSGTKSSYTPDLRSPEETRPAYDELRASAKRGYGVNTGYVADKRSAELSMQDYKKYRAQQQGRQYADGTQGVEVSNQSSWLDNY